MSEIGYIKLHRCIRDCYIWDDESEIFDKRSAWIDLLLSATHRETPFLIGLTKYTLHPGQLHTSIEKLSAKWGWNRKRVMRFLNMLEKEDMIRQDRTPKGTTITIVKWAFYQGSEAEEGRQVGQQVGHLMGQQEGQQVGHIQEDKEVKEKVLPKGNTKKKFVKPTVEDVRAYCLEKCINVDAESFVDHYESNGWMIGKSPMKDWKACVRKWGRNTEKRTTQPAKQNSFNNFQNSIPFDIAEIERIKLGQARDG